MRRVVHLNRLNRWAPFLVLSLVVFRQLEAGFACHADLPGVWFRSGDTNGYSNTVVIEMRDYLIVVDANYPGRAKELLTITKQLSPKPVRYVFDTPPRRPRVWQLGVDRGGCDHDGVSGCDRRDESLGANCRWKNALPRRGPTCMRRARSTCSGLRMSISGDEAGAERRHARGGFPALRLGGTLRATAMYG